MTANAAYFFGGTRSGLVDDGGVKVAKTSLLTIYNTTGGASANYAIL